MHIKKSNAEVLVADERIVKLQATFIDSLKKGALGNIRKRIRLCTHPNIDDPIHEMFIVHTRGVFIRPHKHLNKIESLHVIEGLADVVFFDEKGQITDVINIGDYPSGLEFYFRIQIPVYHTLLVKSKYLIFHEVTKGPFSNSDTVFAPWSPNEKDSLGVKIFLKALSQKIKNRSPRRNKN